MRIGVRSSVLTLVAVGALALLVGMKIGVTAQGQPGYKAPRLRGTDHPDLNGIYQAITTANWDIVAHAAQPSQVPSMGAWFAEPAGLGIVEGNEIPYKPEALKQKKANFDQRQKADVYDQKIGDPENRCFMPSVPRATYMPFPFQIVQGSSKYISIAYEFAATSRTIHMDNLPLTGVDSWMGESRGRWEGDTLVVDVKGFNDLSWFDRAGNFHSDELHVVERYTPISPYHLMYEATIEDPEVFTRSWKIKFPLYRDIEAGARLLEFRCIPFAEELLYGRFRAKK